MNTDTEGKQAIAHAAMHRVVEGSLEDAAVLPSCERFASRDSGAASPMGPSIDMAATCGKGGRVPFKGFGLF